LPPKLGIIALLHRRVEGVHVDMDDLADGLVGLGHGRILLSYSGVTSLGGTDGTLPLLNHCHERS